jgi:pimeloyl-ACP methyl ester carboxylesterase
MTRRSAALQTQYVDEGEGPAVVFSHGTMMDHTMFAHQVEHLTGVRRIAYDSRARTELRAGGPYSLADLADDCVALLDELEIERCTLAGMSLGGFMAIEFALRHPDRLDGLVLIATKAGAYGDQDVAEYEQNFGALRDMPTVDEKTARWEAQIVFGPYTREHHPERIEHWVQRYRRMPGESVYWETMSWIRKADRHAALARVTVPTLVVHGVDDFVLPLVVAERTAAALPHATFDLIADSGHTLTVEQPERTTESLARWLTARRVGCAA